MEQKAKMEPDDVVRVVSFNSRVAPLGTPGLVREVGEGVVGRVQGLYASGNTQLYDALLSAMEEVEPARVADKGERIYHQLAAYF